MKEKLKIKLNGNPVSLEAEGDMRLLWLIRTDLGLTGTKCGCGEGFCGACTVLINGKAARSCQVSVWEIQGKELMTIEGLARQGNLHPLQKAFVDHGALQCGLRCHGHQVVPTADDGGKSEKCRKSQVVRGSGA